MQSEEILDALEEYLGQSSVAPVGSPGKTRTEATSSNSSCRPISRGMCNPPARLRSPAVPFETSSSPGRSRRTPPRTSAPSWIRSSSSGTPGAMRSIGTRRGCEGTPGSPCSPTSASSTRTRWGRPWRACARRTSGRSRLRRRESYRPPNLSMSGGNMTRQPMKTLRRWLPAALLLRLFIPRGGGGSVS
jgi:hypothetical protein